MKHINLVHALIIGTTLMYIGIRGNDTEKFIFYSLAFDALLIPFIVNYPRNTKLTYWNVINTSHFIIILPWLLYLGFNNEEISKEYQKAIFFIGLFISIYHGYKAYIRYNR